MTHISNLYTITSGSRQLPRGNVQQGFFLFFSFFISNGVTVNIKCFSLDDASNMISVRSRPTQKDITVF